VTYNVVIGVENKDLRLKPGMTANVSIIVDQKDQVLKVPNAALRFTPVKSERADGARPLAVPPSQPARSAGETGRVKAVWRIGASGDPEAVPVDVGISDGVWTAIVTDELKESDDVIIGIESVRSGRRPDSLPPGFGSGQPRRSRDRL